MTTKPGFGQKLKNDLENGAYRAGARKVSELATQGFVLLLKKQKFTKPQIRMMVQLLDTTNGQAFVSFLLGMALPQMPGIGKDPRVERLCKEFRIEGMAIAGENLLDAGINTFAPKIKNILDNMSSDGKGNVMQDLNLVKEQENLFNFVPDLPVVNQEENPAQPAKS